jgi:hypothetical protein
MSVPHISRWVGIWRGDPVVLGNDGSEPQVAECLLRRSSLRRMPGSLGFSPVCRILTLPQTPRHSTCDVVKGGSRMRLPRRDFQSTSPSGSPALHRLTSDGAHYDA